MVGPPVREQISKLLQMSNGITDRQNEPDQLDRLAAQRHLYSSAKRAQLLQIVLAVPPALLWPLIVGLHPSWAVFAAIWSVFVALLDVAVISNFVQNCKRAAARIQESFDCYVLALDWHSLHSGPEPNREAVLLLAKKFDLSKGDRKALVNWYPVSTGALPVSLGRIICQRASCWWDGELRRRYSQAVMAFMCLVIAISVVTGLVFDLTLQRFVLAVVVPLLPLILFCVRQFVENRNAANSIDELRSHAEKLWQHGLANTKDDASLKAECRDLQCEIFSHRKSAPLIFDRIYGRLQRAHEEAMNAGSDQLVREANAALGQV